MEGFGAGSNPHHETSQTDDDLPSRTLQSGASSTSAPAAPQRTPSQTSLHKSSPHMSTHRQSFAENLRNAPGSPRAQRHPSFTQAAVQELLNHPPAAHKHTNPRFAGRDWRDISVNELVSQDDVKWVNLDASVEEASMVYPPLRSPLVSW